MFQISEILSDNIGVIKTLLLQQIAYFVWEVQEKTCRLRPLYHKKVKVLNKGNL